MGFISNLRHIIFKEKCGVKKTDFANATANLRRGVTVKITLRPAWYSMNAALASTYDVVGRFDGVQDVKLLLRGMYPHSYRSIVKLVEEQT